MKRLFLPFAAVVLLAWAGVVFAQNSAGGAFLPLFDYIVSGQWTWRSTLTPWVIEGATDNDYEARHTFAEPTADRTYTWANTSGNVALSGSAATAGIRAGTTALDGSNPTSVTTGLSVLASCQVHQDTSVAPGLGPITFTVIRTATAGQLDIYAWKATSASNPTLVASTSSDTVDYTCIGTP